MDERLRFVALCSAITRSRQRRVRRFLRPARTRSSTHRTGNLRQSSSSSRHSTATYVGTTRSGSRSHQDLSALSSTAGASESSLDQAKFSAASPPGQYSAQINSEGAFIEQKRLATDRTVGAILGGHRPSWIHRFGAGRARRFDAAPIPRAARRSCVAVRGYLGEIEPGCGRTVAHARVSLRTLWSDATHYSLQRGTRAAEESIFHRRPAGADSNQWLGRRVGIAVERLCCCCSRHGGYRGGSEFRART